MAAKTAWTSLSKKAGVAELNIPLLLGVCEPRKMLKSLTGPPLRGGGDIRNDR